jgi:hypothetical protein
VDAADPVHTAGDAVLDAVLARLMAEQAEERARGYLVAAMTECGLRLALAPTWQAELTATPSGRGSLRFTRRGR